jgi:hypothetical protein
MAALLSPAFCDYEVPAVLSKIQIALSILAGVGIVIFVFGVTTNLQVKQFGPVSGLNGLLAWGSFGLVFASCIGVVVTQALEFREPKEPKALKEPEAEPVAEKVAPGEELAPVVATAEEPVADVAATAESGDFEAMPEGLQTELDAGEGLGEALPDLDADFLDFKDE